jgi:hypothetical protein
MAADQPINSDAIKQTAREVIVEALADPQSPLRRAIEQVAEDVALSVAAKLQMPVETLHDWPSLEEAYRQKAADEEDDAEGLRWVEGTVGEVADEPR